MRLLSYNDTEFSGHGKLDLSYCRYDDQGMCEVTKEQRLRDCCYEERLAHCSEEILLARDRLPLDEAALVSVSQPH